MVDDFSLINWWRRAYLIDDLKPLFEQEWVETAVIELLSPGLACHHKTEWIEGGKGMGFDSFKAYCHRLEGHEGDHIALKTPPNKPLAQSTILKRWK